MKNSMVDTLIILKSDATICSVNQALLDLLGYSADELIGKSVGMIFLEGENPFDAANISKLIQEGLIKNCDINYKAKNGEKIPVCFFSSGVRNREGSLIGIVCIARDMRGILGIISDEISYCPAVIISDKRHVGITVVMRIIVFNNGISHTADIHSGRRASINHVPSYRAAPYIS